MFVLKLNPTYQWPVSFKVPADGGEYTELEFTAIFNRMNKQWLVDVDEKIKADTLKQDGLVGEVLAGWKGIMDPAQPEQELDFTPKTLKELLKIPGAGPAIVAAFFASVNGAFEGN